MDDYNNNSNICNIAPLLAGAIQMRFFGDNPNNMTVKIQK